MLVIRYVRMMIVSQLFKAQGRAFATKERGEKISVIDTDHTDIELHDLEKVRTFASPLIKASFIILSALIYYLILPFL
ncbi:hypothetical protein D3C81_1918870 [compost metagenome]